MTETDTDTETAQEQTEYAVDPRHLREKEQPLEGEVNPLLRHKQCYQVSSHIKDHMHMLGGGLLIDLPKGGTQTSYREIIKLYMIRDGTYPTHKFHELEKAADDNARRANKSIVITIALWGGLTIFWHIVTQGSSVPNTENWIFSAILSGLIIGWKLIPDFYRTRRAARLLDRTAYETQLLRENFNEDEDNHPDLQDIHQFNNYMEECNFQKAGEIAKKNDWYQLINKQYLTQHYANIMNYFRTKERGRKAKKGK